MKKPVVFKPDGNDLIKVMYYYGIELDEQIVCPFHDDHKPSCNVNFDEGIFHCWACSASGDAFDFVKLANPNMRDLNQLILYFTILKSKKVKKLKLQKFQSQKKERSEEDRKIDAEVAEDYYFGLRTIDWNQEENEYKDYLLNRGYNTKILNEIKAKLTITNTRFPIIFPIYDLDQFRGWVCRTTTKAIEKRGKYLYNKGFSRNDTLGGKYNNDVVMLCEGYLDMLKFKQFGVKYIAAIFGWKITRKQIDKLKAQGVKTIISALDTDGPGRKGTDYLRNFFDVVEFQFPKGVKDPGDMNEKQFKVANNKTKTLYRKRRRKNVNSR